MKNISLRIKITLWVALLLAAVIGLTYAVIFSVNNSVMSRNARDVLVETVSANVGEIEYHDSGTPGKDDEGDQYIVYGDGFLEIDDDYLDRTNGVYTSLYTGGGSLLYGDNPIAKETAHSPFIAENPRRLNVSGTVWYIYDYPLSGDGIDGLWLRGIISSETEKAQLSSIARITLILMPLLLIVGIGGAYLAVSNSLAPMKRVARTASRISGGNDLGTRIDIGRGSDEVHAIADSFNEMLSRLEGAFESERRFTSDASHELRTPTSVIMAQCEYTLGQERSPEEYREALSSVRRQGARMTHLVDDMLSLTRLEQKTDGNRMTDTDLSAVIGDVASDMQHIGERGITLTCEIEPDIHIYGNAELLSRLASNLIGNAYRYGRENGHIHVSLTSGEAGRATPFAPNASNAATETAKTTSPASNAPATAAGDDALTAAILSVADDGIGIAEDDKERIFRRFYRADNARSGGGTGLGLAIVRQIAHMHSAEVTVNGALGEGSTFTVVFKKTKNSAEKE